MQNKRLFAIGAAAFLILAVASWLFVRAVTDDGTGRGSGTSNYVNAQAKFSFAYPSDWGTVQPLPSLSTEQRQAFTFSTQPNIIFKVHARDLGTAADDKLYSALRLVDVNGGVATLTQAGGTTEQKASQAPLNGAPCAYDEKALSAISGEAGPDDKYLLGYCETGDAKYGAVIFDGGAVAATDAKYQEQKTKLTPLLSTFRTD